MSCGAALCCTPSASAPTRTCASTRAQATSPASNSSRSLPSNASAEPFSRRITDPQTARFHEQRVHIRRSAYAALCILSRKYLDGSLACGRLEARRLPGGAGASAGGRTHRLRNLIAGGPKYRAPTRRRTRPPAGGRGAREPGGAPGSRLLLHPGSLHRPARRALAPVLHGSGARAMDAQYHITVGTTDGGRSDRQPVARGPSGMNEHSSKAGTELFIGLIRNIEPHDEPLTGETSCRIRVEQRSGRRACLSPIWVRPEP